MVVVMVVSQHTLRYVRNAIPLTCVFTKGSQNPSAAKNQCEAISTGYEIIGTSALQSSPVQYSAVEIIRLDSHSPLCMNKHPRAHLRETFHSRSICFYNTVNLRPYPQPSYIVFIVPALDK